MHDLLAELGGRGDGQVDRDGRATDAALRAEDRDDPTRLAAAVARSATAARAGRRDRRGGHAAGLVALAGVDLSDRGGQLVAAERLDEELARSGQHGPAQVVGLALDGHHHDGRGGERRGQLLGGRDAVHVRHVDVHQDDVRA